MKRVITAIIVGTIMLTTLGQWASATPASGSGVASVCGSTAPPPLTYQHVVVIMEENRTWSEVGGPGFAAMPYLNGLATQCAFYTQWLETNPQQSSLTQYIGLTSGVDHPAITNNCPPTACRSRDNNIFAQVRVAGGTPRTYIEGATKGCQVYATAANVPALYYYGSLYQASNGHNLPSYLRTKGATSLCQAEVRPLDELNVDQLPTFAMITPDLCSNGHSCNNDTADAWLSLHLASILAGASYLSGTTAVFVIYDEDRPVPNLLIAPTAVAGPLTTPVASHSAALRTIDEMLGLPVLPSVSSAQSLRSSAHI